MHASLVSIQMGLPRVYRDVLASDPAERLWTTGIYKTPVQGEVQVGPDGLIGDGQADLTVHGGADKAICVYSGDHYPTWRQRPELAAMGPGAFGENFTLQGITEDDVCIGDQVMHGRPRNRAAAATLAGLPALSASWRATLARR